MLILIKAPGMSATRTDITDNAHAQLRAMQQIVDGYIEIAVKARDFVVWCNEEGKLVGLPLNFHRPQDGDGIVGTVFVTGPLVGSRDGYIPTSIAEANIERVTKLLDAWAAAGQLCGCDPAHFDPQTPADREYAVQGAQVRRAEEGMLL